MSSHFFLMDVPVMAVLQKIGKLALGTGALTASLIGMTGCQSITVNASHLAQLRVVDASIDSGGLDIYSNGVGLAYNVGFGTASSYVPVQPAGYTITADRANTRQVLVSGGATLYPAKQYTAIVGNTASNLQEAIIQDQSIPAPSGQVSVRILNWATKVGNVDVYLVPSSATLANTNVFAANVSFEGNSGYINVPAGTYAVAVVPTGSVPLSSTVTLLSSSQQYYSTGTVHTIVLIDQQVTTSPAVNAIILDDFDSPSTS